MRSIQINPTEIDDPAFVADHVVNEFSVDRATLGGRTKLVMAHSEEVFGSRIMLRTADRAEGPWSNPIPVYLVQGVTKNKEYFTYGAKAHAHLSREGELLISYLINDNDLWTMAADADIYRTVSPSDSFRKGQLK